MSLSLKRRELAKTIVERCVSTRSRTRSSTCGQIEADGALALCKVGLRVETHLELSYLEPEYNYLDLKDLVSWRLDDADRPPSGQEYRYLIDRTNGLADRPMRWAGGCSKQVIQTFERQGQMAPRLVARRVNLIDDDCVDTT